MHRELIGFVALSFFGGAMLLLCPEGGARRVLNLLFTSVLAAAIISPLRDFDYDVFSMEEARLGSAQAEIMQRGLQSEERLKAMLLRTNCERYLVSRGEALGLRITKGTVEIGKDNEGNPYPFAAEIHAVGSAESAEMLCALLRDELGIPPERQVWLLDE
jgi:hypothetical protein